MAHSLQSVCRRCYRDYFVGCGGRLGYAILPLLDIHFIYNLRQPHITSIDFKFEYVWQHDDGVRCNMKNHEDGRRKICGQALDNFSEYFDPASRCSYYSDVMSKYCPYYSNENVLRVLMKSSDVSAEPIAVKSN